jgi:hypothetical protein
MLKKSLVFVAPGQNQKKKIPEERLLETLAARDILSGRDSAAVSRVGETKSVSPNSLRGDFFAHLAALPFAPIF